MKKTFEISAYGVEEMNQQELLMVDGGGWLGDLLLGIMKVAKTAGPIASVICAVAAVYELCNSREEAEQGVDIVRETVRPQFRPWVDEACRNIDSVLVKYYPDGTPEN